ncbi:MAG: type II secretion system protein [Fimbriimonadaceae bacterium]
MRRGVTLVEVLVAVGIIAVLTGILTPVFKSAKRGAQIASTSSKLHQVHLATTLYRQAYDGDGVYGPIYQMGLPDAEMLSATLYDDDPRGFFDPIDLHYSSCGFHPATSGHHEWMPFDSNDRWTIPVLDLQDRMPLDTDMSCNDADVAVYGKWNSKFGVGVTLGGWIVRKHKTGANDDPYWWQ